MKTKQEEMTTTKQHVLNVEKDAGDVWRVTEKIDHYPKGNVYPLVGPGETVTWQSSSNLVFQFPPYYHHYFLKPSGYAYEVAVHNEVLKANKPFTLTVRDDAPFGRVLYSILVLKDCVFAQGGSEPCIIIKDH